MIKRLLAFVISLITVQVIAQNPVISTKDFASEIKSNKNLVIVDVNAPEIYAKQHIQGAINLFFRELYQPSAVEGKLKPASELAAILGKKGISNTAKIVVYENESNKHNNRVWWILKSLGAKDVWTLHVDAKTFATAQIAMNSVPATAKPTTFTVTDSPYKSLTMEDVKNLPKGTLLLDGREKEEFEGVDAARKSKGHIPGAVWMNYREVLTSTGAFKTKDEIVAAAAKYGATPEKPIVVYCNSGVKASTLLVGLKEIAGFQNVQYYGGSYADWSSNPSNPIVK
ncbi:MAG TPA: rhodanese-like domain-containing protein [Prolixibacteraceae bacterium]|nr:rhodanese-like domain-containing protein [Prolixibacteraceae bacterium]